MIKSFLIKLSVYCIVLAFFFWATMIGLSDRYYNTRVPVLKYQILTEIANAKNNKNLILGSSHSMYGINPSLIGSNYINLASISQSLKEDYEILLHCIRKGINIDSVIIPLSYFSNHQSLYLNKIPGEKIRIYEYSRLYDIKYPTNISLKEYLILGSAIINNTIDGLPTNRFQENGNLTGDCSGKEFQITDTKKAFNRHSIDSNFQMINNYIDSLVTICEREKINLNFVVMPFSKEYLESLNSTTFNAWLRRINADYSSETCRIIDLKDSLRDENENIIFKDADHLSYCGRDKFSLVLKKALEM